jgi:hypothetical protein
MHKETHYGEVGKMIKPSLVDVQLELLHFINNLPYQEHIDNDGVTITIRCQEGTLSITITSTVAAILSGLRTK